MVRIFPRFLVDVRSRCGAWFGVLLIALLVLGSPARAAQPRLLAPVGPPGAPVEDAEEHASVALRESRAEAIRADRPAHRIRPEQRPASAAGLSPRRSPRVPDPFGNGLGSRLRC